MNLIDYLGIKVINQSSQKVELQVTVTANIMQPYGLVHGGINSVLAETAASMGANLNLTTHQIAVGMNINTQHLRAVKSGVLLAQATPIKIGKQTQVWQAVTYQDQLNNPTSYSTITLLNQKQN
jgi:1,4-dihydroxy-2-naphthoyl-CoA hydrolase